MRILVVEDEVGIATSLQRGLTADGFTVDVADNGLDGLWLAQQHPYSLIVLDLLLPGLNGYRVCRQLREDGNDVPILMLTAKDGELDEAEGLETGADDYVTKPFSYTVLLARIRALLRRAEGSTSRPEQLQFGHLVIDTRSHVVTAGGVPVDLSPRAVAVLAFMMRNPNAVLSKDEILRNVWDHAFVGDPNIVEVYVSRIRAAIVPDGAAVVTATGRSMAVVETVRGVGYRLVEQVAS